MLLVLCQPDRILMKNLLLLLTIIFFSACHAQTLTEDRDKIDAASQVLTPATKQYATCLQQGAADQCIRNLVSAAKNDYEKYIVGNTLYQADAAESFRLHQEVYQANPNNLYFNLEYAIGLHRKGEYQKAAELYEKYSKQKPDDIRLYVWLADCYINTGDVDKAISNWNKAGHSRHHTSIDFAIGTIYGDTLQVKKRSGYRDALKHKVAEAIYPLIFLDANWELDWWNTIVRKDNLDQDLALVKEILKEDNTDYKVITAYAAIKKTSQSFTAADTIKNILKQNNLLVGKGGFPVYGPVASDLLRICFINKILDETQFNHDRGAELLKNAHDLKDKELMNIYAYLQSTVNGHVDPATDLSGWKEFHDERFAMSYFIGKAAKNSYDDPELAQAIKDFPNSSGLYWIKANCAKIERRSMHAVLIELTKRDFKTLNSGGERSSYQLNSFFAALQTEK